MKTWQIFSILICTTILLAGISISTRVACTEQDCDQPALTTITGNAAAILTFPLAGIAHLLGMVRSSFSGQEWLILRIAGIMVGLVLTIGVQYGFSRLVSKHI